MTSRQALSVSPAESFVTRVRAFLKAEGLTPGWLARRTGLGYNNLRRWLERPHLLPFDAGHSISQVTGVPAQERAE